MARRPRLVIQLARGGAVDRQLSADPPPSDFAVERLEPDPAGHLVAPDVGQVVLSVPSPETLAREPDEVRRVVDHAGSGAEPLVVVVGAAEQLRDDELSAVLDAAEHTERAVILRIAADA